MNLPEIGFSVAAGLPPILVAWIYAAGARRRMGVRWPAADPHHAAFAAGLALLLLSMQWPFARWAHELFYVHQIGIMIARIVAPLLMAMARPCACLIAGLPRPLREKMLKPFLLMPVVQKAWRLVVQPAVAVILYVGTLYFWELPAAQAAALGHFAIGLLMHLSLLLAGLLFWGRIFERRPAPHGVGHGARLMMLWLAILTQIALGAYITVKTTVLYHAYAATERLMMISPIADEARGGVIIWIMSALISLPALIVVIHMWGLHETRMDAKRLRWSPSNSAILLYPETGRALREMARPKNRRLAFGLTTFVLLVFVAICGMASASYRIHRRENIRLYMLSKS